MSLLFYAGKSKKASTMAQIIIQGQASKEAIEIFTAIEDLATRLRRPRGDVILMILLISNQKELTEMLLIRDLLADIPTILILPDRKKKTISLGHKLCPRFLSYQDSDFSDVALVLNKMMSNFWAEEKRMKKIWHSLEKQAQTAPRAN